MEERGEGRDRLFYFDSGWDSGGLFLDGKEPQVFIKCGEFLGQLRNWQLLKKGTAIFVWSELCSQAFICVKSQYVTAFVSCYTKLVTCYLKIYFFFVYTIFHDTWLLVAVAMKISPSYLGYIYSLNMGVQSVPFHKG